MRQSLIRSATGASTYAQVSTVAPRDVIQFDWDAIVFGWSDARAGFHVCAGTPELQCAS
jgi:hypothetical protein